MRQPNIGALGVLDVFARLKVPDGMYFIIAKMNIDNDSKTVQTVDARLVAGQDSDRNIVRVGPSGETSWDMAALTFTVVHTFPGTSRKNTTT